MSLEDAKGFLQESEDWYCSLFKDSPISFWEGDFADVKTHIDSLRGKGVKDFRTYFESHPEAVANCASMVKVIWVNMATLELYKARGKEEFQNGLGTVFGEESYDVFREGLIAIAEGKTRFESEAVTQTLIGDKKHSVLRWYIAPGYEETLSEVLVSIIGITERKRAERELTELEEKYSALIENAGDGFYTIDLKGNFTFVNDRLAEIHGFSKEELLKMNFMELLHQDELQRVGPIFQKSVETGISPEDLEIKCARKDSGIIYVRPTPNFIREEEEIVDIQGIIWDITERKQAEEA